MITWWLLLKVWVKWSGTRKRWHGIAKATVQGKVSDRSRWSIGPRVTLITVAGNVRTTPILILKPHSLLGFNTFYHVSTCLKSNATVLGQPLSFNNTFTTVLAKTTTNNSNFFIIKFIWNKIVTYTTHKGFTRLYLYIFTYISLKVTNFLLRSYTTNIYVYL